MAKGSITQLFRDDRPGYILDEDGCMVKFDESSFDGPVFLALSVGNWVEYDELYPVGGRRAVHIRRISRNGWNSVG